MSFVATTVNIYLEQSDLTRVYPLASDIIVKGNKIDVKFRSGFGNLTQGKIVIKLKPDCASCIPNPVDTISIKSFYSASSCSSCENELGCASLFVTIQCVTTCGGFNIKFGKRSYFDRETFGFADYNGDGIPDNTIANSINRDSIHLDRASCVAVVGNGILAQFFDPNNSNEFMFSPATKDI